MLRGLLALGVLLFPPAPARWSELAGEDRTALFEKARTQPLGERLISLSTPFLGTPYQISPLGEGTGKDPDPLWRYDAVDCLTFVEETIALSLAPSLEGAPDILSALRYAKMPRYEDRNHLMEAQWLPNNVAKGFIHDVTREFGEGVTQRTQKVITHATWKSASARALDLPKDHQPEGRFPLRVIPLAQTLEKVSGAPDGTLLLVVREDRPSRVTRVSHLGFLHHAQSRLYLRHATKGWLNAVVDEELGHFLARINRHNDAGDWKVVGVSLYQVTPAAR